VNLNPLTWGRRSQPQAAEVLDESSDLFRLFANAYATATGVSVTSDSAVASVAVLACILVRSELLMLCPVDVVQKDGRRRIEQPDHPVARLLSDEWNPLLGAEEAWRWKQQTEDLKGNTFARVEWKRGRPDAIWPWTNAQPPEVIAAVVKGEPTLVYRYQGDEFNKANDYPANEILHWKGPLVSKTPYMGRSLVDVTSENIGLGIASEQFFARFLGNGTHFPAYLQTDSKLGEKDIDALKKQLEDGSGLMPAGVLRIFDRGLKVMQNEMSLKDADLSSHQRWILEQVCRTWRVPLPMVQDLTHGTYTNSEQADLWLTKHTATPIVRSTEGVIRRRLFLPSERSTLRAKFNVNALMRGDFAARSAGYSVLISCGVLNPNEARAFEDWNPYEGGDEFRQQVNTAAVGTAADPTNKALALLIGDAKSRIEARHAQNVERGRDTADSVAFGTKVLEPIAQAAAELGVGLDGQAIAELIIKEATS
jgi:HK97 family phage portal protein